MADDPQPPPADSGKPAADPPDATLGQDEIESLLESSQAGDRQRPPQSPAAEQSDDAIARRDMDLLLSQAEAALASVNEPDASPPEHVKPFQLRDFTGAPASSEAATLDLIRDVELDVTIELGRSQMYLEEVLRLRKGSVVPLDKLAGDPVDIYVNGRLVARGEILVLNDNFCVRIAELIAGDSAAA